MSNETYNPDDSPRLAVEKLFSRVDELQRDIQDLQGRLNLLNEMIEKRNERLR